MRNSQPRSNPSRIGALDQAVLYSCMPGLRNQTVDSDSTLLPEDSV